MQNSTIYCITSAIDIPNNASTLAIMYCFIHQQCQYADYTWWPQFIAVLSSVIASSE